MRVIPDCPALEGADASRSATTTSRAGGKSAARGGHTRRPAPTIILSKEEERELIRRAQHGDAAARDRIWVAFHTLAVKEARRLARRKGADADEAESDAALAIPEAIDRFDLRRDVRFSTYLTERVAGTVTTVARQQRRQAVFDPAQRRPERLVPEHQEDKPAPGQFWSPKALAWAKRVRRKTDRLIIKWLWLDARPKSQAEIARKLGITRSAVCQRRRVLMKRISEKDRTAIFDQRFVGVSLNRFLDFGYIGFRS
jgi:RNA polymerase sigma factor (sigma-70 family)